MFTGYINSVAAAMFLIGLFFLFGTDRQIGGFVAMAIPFAYFSLRYGVKIPRF